MTAPARPSRVRPKQRVSQLLPAIAAISALGLRQQTLAPNITAHDVSCVSIVTARPARPARVHLAAAKFKPGNSRAHRPQSLESRLNIRTPSIAPQASATTNGPFHPQLSALHPLSGSVWCCSRCRADTMSSRPAFAVALLPATPTLASPLAARPFQPQQ